MNNEQYRVLLIEDDRLDQMAFERFVQEQNLPYNYTIASCVAEAREVIHSDKFEVIIADYNLGDGTVFDIIDLMKEIPTIITTGAGCEDIAVKAMKEGVYDYLVKDVEHNYLKVLPVIIENAIEHKKTNNQIMMLSHAIMNIYDSVYITDLNNKIIFVNKSFSETYGYQQDEISGKNSLILDDCESDKKEKNTYLQDNIGDGITGEFCNKRKDGSTFPVSLTKSIIKDKDNIEFAIVAVARDISEKKKAEQERERLIDKLKDALAKVKTLSGFLPICSSCKKIRDDQGYWNQIEQYIKEHSEADFSHSICPDCARKLYPELYRNKE